MDSVHKARKVGNKNQAQDDGSSQDDGKFSRHLQPIICHLQPIIRHPEQREGSSRCGTMPNSEVPSLRSGSE